jgi:outer membrane receptor protein involved in Fe transport
MYGESGFGSGFNFTLVDGDVEFDVESFDHQSPLAGLSDSANFQVFYEKDGLSVKITYAWRDDYLIGVGQAQGSAEAPPQFGKEYAQTDISVNYDITDELTVFFEGINITNETEQGYGRYEEQFLFARQYGPRYALGARYTF